MRGRPGLVNRSLVSMKIRNQAALIPDSKSFGYTSKDVVKEQYNNCMMKGKYEVICELICSKNSDHGTDDEPGNKCDICRGKNLTVRFSLIILRRFMFFLDGLAKLEEHCLQKLFTDDFFWN